MTPLVVELPLPSKNVHSNARVHWATKARSAKQMRLDAGLVAGSIMSRDSRDPFQNPVVSAIFYHATKRVRDRSNFIGASKNYEDGFTDAGVWKDDNLVRWGEVEFEVDKQNPRVIFTITERFA